MNAPTLPKHPEEQKLSPLGKTVEKLLKRQLEDMEKDLRDHPKPEDAEKRRYTLTDVMKVTDRVLKLEAIRAKIGEGDGEFFDDAADEILGDGDEERVDDHGTDT